MRHLDEGSLRLLLRYKWPGNVRELRNAVERATLIAQGETITREDLPEKVTSSGGSPESISAVSDEGTITSFRERLREYEIALIVDALRKSGGNQTEAARLLGLPLRTLVYKLTQYHIREKYYEL
jgi:DNA-binding NtrC family response regulator